MPKTMLQKEVNFKATLTYKIKMFKCTDLILNDPLSYFQVLVRPQETSQSYLHLMVRILQDDN